MKFKILALVLACAFVLGGCGTTNENPDNLVDNPGFDTELELPEAPPTAEELHETATYKSFGDTYYGEIPADVRKLLVFLECTRENMDATFSDRYFSYFEYENMEEVVADYYKVLGCSTDESTPAQVVDFYGTYASLQTLCQDMYDNLLSEGNENLSLVMECSALKLASEEPEFYLVDYDYQKDTGNDGWFSFEKDKSTDEPDDYVLYTNNGQFQFYKLTYLADKETWTYFVVLPKGSFLLNNGQNVVIKTSTGFTCMTANEINTKIKSVCATPHLYPIAGVFAGDYLEDVEDWVSYTNSYAEDIDENAIYTELFEDLSLSLPLYVNDQRLYAASSYLPLLPDNARTDDIGNATEYGLCIKDLSGNANK